MIDVAPQRQEMTARVMEGAGVPAVEAGVGRYRISVRPADAGRLTQIIDRPPAGGNVGNDTAADRRCFEALFGRSEPCRGCPVLAGAAAPTNQWVIPPGAPGGAYRIVTLRWVDDGVVELAHHAMDESLVDAVIRSRVESRTSRAMLTRRELAVLNLIISGAATSDVAESLGIGRRTTRFHIANILKKLGADSRADLLRIFL